jgi:hypothetical protein
MKKLILISAFLLSGCAELAAMEAQQQAQIENNKKQYCANMGAPEGSPNYYNCRTNLEQMLMAEQQAKDEAYRNAVRESNESFNQSANRLLEAGRSRPNLINNSVRCTSTPNALGGMDTTCH